MQLLVASLSPDLLRFADAELPSTGHSPAAATSRSARAWRRAASAVLTLVLACVDSPNERVWSGCEFQCTARVDH